MDYGITKSERKLFVSAMNIGMESLMTDNSTSQKDVLALEKLFFSCCSSSQQQSDERMTTFDIDFFGVTSRNEARVRNWFDCIMKFCDQRIYNQGIHRSLSLPKSMKVFISLPEHLKTSVVTCKSVKEQIESALDTLKNNRKFTTFVSSATTMKRFDLFNESANSASVVDLTPLSDEGMQRLIDVHVDVAGSTSTNLLDNENQNIGTVKLNNGITIQYLHSPGTLCNVGESEEQLCNVISISAHGGMQDVLNQCSGKKTTKEVYMNCAAFASSPGFGDTDTTTAKGMLTAFGLCGQPYGVLGTFLLKYGIIKLTVGITFNSRNFTLLSPVEKNEESSSAERTVLPVSLREPLHVVASIFKQKFVKDCVTDILQQYKEALRTLQETTLVEKFLVAPHRKFHSWGKVVLEELTQSHPLISRHLLFDDIHLTSEICTTWANMLICYPSEYTITIVGPLKTKEEIEIEKKLMKIRMERQVYQKWMAWNPKSVVLQTVLDSVEKKMSKVVSTSSSQPWRKRVHAEIARALGACAERVLDNEDLVTSWKERCEKFVGGISHLDVLHEHQSPLLFLSANNIDESSFPLPELNSPPCIRPLGSAELHGLYSRSIGTKVAISVHKHALQMSTIVLSWPQTTMTRDQFKRALNTFQSFGIVGSGEQFRFPDESFVLSLLRTSLFDLLRGKMGATYNVQTVCFPLSLTYSLQTISFSCDNNVSVEVCRIAYEHIIDLYENGPTLEQIETQLLQMDHRGELHADSRMYTWLLMGMRSHGQIETQLVSDHPEIFEINSEFEKLGIEMTQNSLYLSKSLFQNFLGVDRGAMRVFLFTPTPVVVREQVSNWERGPMLTDAWELCQQNYINSINKKYKCKMVLAIAAFVGGAAFVWYMYSCGQSTSKIMKREI